MSDIKELELLVATRTALILVRTTETKRVEEMLRRLTARTGRALFRWTMATGLQALQPTGSVADRQKPTDMLEYVLQSRVAALFLVLDLQRVFNDPVVLSQLQEIAARQDKVPHTLILVGAELDVPDELRGFAARFDLKLPTLQEIETLVHDEAADWSRRNRKRVQAQAPAISALARNLLGLPANEARRLIRTAIHDDGLLDEADLPAIVDAKYQLLGQEGTLTLETSNTRLADVAGLDNLKRWLETRKEVFLSSAPPAGLDPPKGLLLLGVQGSGKSLAAKAVAGAWGLPLLRLDFATLYNKYYGETERNLRESLRTADLMSPCVLWIDEIEKGLAADFDGGPGKRILGTLLTWMAERRSRVFLVATANDIEALPPELMRKGRFDEIFFVDLPDDAARTGIFGIHMRKRGLDTAMFDTAGLAQQSAGFSGAEIEQAVVSALYSAHARKEALHTGHISVEIAATRPLSVMMAEKIAALRAWASTRTVSAK